MTQTAQRSQGITAIAIIFFTAGTYLLALGGFMLAFRGAISMTMGSLLLNGLELAGPYMFLLIGAAAFAIGFGLLKLNNWARRLAIMSALIGMIMLIPTVSSAAVDFRPALLWSGLGVVVRVIIIWYLWQAPVTEAFRKDNPP